jgi:hypothetical protein
LAVIIQLYALLSQLAPTQPYQYITTIATATANNDSGNDNNSKGRSTPSPLPSFFLLPFSLFF